MFFAIFENGTVSILRFGLDPKPETVNQLVDDSQTWETFLLSIHNSVRDLKFVTGVAVGSGQNCDTVLLRALGF